MEAENQKGQSQFSQKIGEKERLKLKGLKDSRSVWMGIGTFGMIGWSVVVPTFLGAMMGLWLDHHYPQSFSWTLTLLTTGLFAGCIIAWNWIEKENKEITKNSSEDDQ